MATKKAPPAESPAESDETGQQLAEMRSAFLKLQAEHRLLQHRYDQLKKGHFGFVENFA